VAGKIKELVGAEHVLTDRESLVCYSFDATRFSSLPDVVVKPGSAGEAAAVIRVAYENEIPVVPRGAGTGLSGGSVPARGGIVISTERMNASPIVHKEDLYAEVEAGVVTEAFQQAVEKRGLFYPPDPASKSASTIGGNLAECAGGLRGLKYGTTRDYVLGLEMVTPEGRLIRTGARTVKSVAGYDVTRLMVGSEGTLGLVTSAMMRLRPLPPARRTLLARFEDTARAAEAVSAVIASGVVPAILELMGARTVEAVGSYLERDLGRGVLLLVEVDGSRSGCGEDASKTADILKNSFGADLEESRAEEELYWKARRSVLPALTRLAPSVILEDVTVPRSVLPDMVEKTRMIAGKYGLDLAVFGHAGDGNLHPTLLVDGRDRDEMKRVEGAVPEMMRACIDLGGTISGEHGIGLDKAPYLGLELGKTGVQIMRRLKESLDPRGIMNPGKMFDDG
jgi:glycolate oxidase